MDSRQVYSGMDIGTAKATRQQRALVPHHAIDVSSPAERYSAGQFARDARAWIREIRERGNVPLLVGGTGFFLHALTHPLFDEPEMPRARREALKRWLAARPLPEVYRWLEQLDPETAESRGPGGGRQRVTRALEVALLSGRPVSWWHRHSPPSEAPLQFRTFVLSLPRETLYERINRRVLNMLHAGLVPEVEGLLASGINPSDPGMNATGYPEIVRFLRGASTLEQAIDEMQRASRRYARRQLTWFRHQLPKDAVWIEADRPAADIAEQVVRTWLHEEAP
jgi:tRNA dimethylallyltransferase